MKLYRQLCAPRGCGRKHCHTVRTYVVPVQLCSCTLYARNARLAKNVQRSFNEICDSRFEWTLPVFFVPVAHHHGLKIVVAEKERANSC